MEFTPEHEKRMRDLETALMMWGTITAIKVDETLNPTPEEVEAVQIAFAETMDRIRKRVLNH